MLRRTTLARRTLLRRGKPLRSSARRSNYARRDRDFAFMGWVKRQPCIVRSLAPDPNRVTVCSGPIEADHLGARGVGRKADDRTCAPLCRKHHRERTDHSGAFRDLAQAELRTWRHLVQVAIAGLWLLERGRSPMETPF